MYLDRDTASDEELVRHCSRSNPTRDVIHELDGGLSVIRISNDTVVKYGYGVAYEEFVSQQNAYDLIDKNVIRVPRVHRFFTYMHIGYIVMEYMDGNTLSSDWDSLSCQVIADVLAHFSGIRNEQPGPLSGGRACGLLWIEGDSISPTSSGDIERYFNTRQLRCHDKLAIQGHRFVLCHLDIAPRNIMRLKDGSFCLLDWASAGFYPRFFEICTLRLNAWTQVDFNSQVLCLLEGLSQDEENQAQLLQKAYYLAQKYVYNLPRRKRKKANHNNI
ncbi:hypothetical protein DE146DRAFT_115060 [Phaeosphaeria sp. MPI-PUGE-AT-0046c]|nr:hypothetical protein DE146DRAFT_115060 [Phaeosphaeria sp. MPI-PUGE-AT-0046c]